MTPDEFRAALDALGLTQNGLARLLVALGDAGNDKARTVQRWAAGEQNVPGAVVALLGLMAVLRRHADLTVDDIRGFVALGDFLPIAEALARHSEPESGFVPAGEAVILEDRRTRR